MRQGIIELGDGRSKGSNPGLVLQRYLRPVAKAEDSPRERRSLLDDAIRAGQSDSLQMVYAGAFRRWNSFPNDDLHQAAELRTQGRLIVGLGSENVLETGIRLHHTYGVPIIPGSALKGLAAHYCNEVWGSDARFKRSSEKNYHRLLFGDTADSGVIVFHDAWITPESLRDAFCLDVMTPHHPGWQDEKNPKAPTDFDSPIPVSFLSVAGTFLVRVSWGGPRDAAAGQWTDLAIQLLHAALANWGVGGKTSSGYGRLESVSTTPTSKTPPAAPSATLVRPPTIPGANTRVEAVLLEEKTKKGGWKAKHEPSGLVGAIQNTADVPTEKVPGDRLNLIVALSNGREIAFKYPTAADEQRLQKSPGNSKSRPGDGNSPHGGRR